MERDRPRLPAPRRLRDPGPGVPVDEGTIAYRLGLLLVIALFAGASARELDLQRGALARLADGQRRLAAASQPAEILRTLCREAVGCLGARSATIYVEDTGGFQPVSAWPADALPGALEEGEGDGKTPDDPTRLRVSLRWRHHPQHLLVVNTKNRPSSFARSIKGVSRLLRSRRDDIAPEAIDEMLQSVERQANRLNRLADDLLDGARLENDKLKLQPMPCDLDLVIAGAVADMEEPTVIKTEGNPRIVADAARLDRVLWNLVSNAEKYGKPPVEVRAWRDERLAHIEVRDHGPGLDASQRAQLFDAFATSDAAAGIGLGLAIVWQLVSAHGGTVRYEDAAPGARFVVSVPAAGPPPLGAG